MYYVYGSDSGTGSGTGSGSGAEAGTGSGATVDVAEVEPPIVADVGSGAGAGSVSSAESIEVEPPYISGADAGVSPPVVGGVEPQTPGVFTNSPFAIVTQYGCFVTWSYRMMPAGAPDPPTSSFWVLIESASISFTTNLPFSSSIKLPLAFTNRAKLIKLFPLRLTSP